jgi:hypothetical protein
MGRVGRAAAHAEDEQAPAGLAHGREPGGHGVDALAGHRERERGGGLEVGVGVLGHAHRR